MIMIRDMNSDQLKKYIVNTKKTIEELLNEYIKLNTKKIEDNKKIHNLKKRAYDLKEIYEYAHWANDKIHISDNSSKSIFRIPKRGEIWTCQLGKNIGSEENKIRPVIVVQNDTGNEKGPTTIVVPISNRPKKIATHIELRDSDYTLVEGEKSKVTGTVLCEQIKVVSKVRLGRHVATLKSDFVENILNSKLKVSLKL
nr:type II toxin-antitoxin system PemK/MazF family toxin [Clostridium fermenticellae]